MLHLSVSSVQVTDLLLITAEKALFFPINDSLCTVSVSVMGINLQVINSDSSEKLLELLELLLLFYRRSKFTRNVNSLLWRACQSSTL